MILIHCDDDATRANGIASLSRKRVPFHSRTSKKETRANDVVIHAKNAAKGVHVGEWVVE